MDRDLVPDGEFFFGEIRDEGLDLVLAELGLDGRLRAVSGVLPAILKATRPGPVAWHRAFSPVPGCRSAPPQPR